jgi:hypothetical protein
MISAEPGTSVVQASHPWLRWRWIPAFLLFLFGALCLLVAALGAFWFDGQGAIILSEIRGVHGWRFELWVLFCTWPANGIKGCLAIYTGRAIWRTDWQAARRAIAVLATLLALAAIANY